MKKSPEIFAFIGAVLLFVHAAPLFIAANDKINVLGLKDQDTIFPLSERHILFSVAGLELALSALLLMPGRKHIRFGIAAWLASSFLVYHFYLYFYAVSMGCLVNLTGRLPVLPEYYDYFTLVLFAGLLVGSLAFMYLDWWSSRRLQNSQVGGAS